MDGKLNLQAAVMGERVISTRPADIGWNIGDTDPNSIGGLDVNVGGLLDHVTIALKALHFASPSWDKTRVYRVQGVP